MGLRVLQKLLEREGEGERERERERKVRKRQRIEDGRLEGKDRFEGFLYDLYLKSTGNTNKQYVCNIVHISSLNKIIFYNNN